MIGPSAKKAVPALIAAWRERMRCSGPRPPSAGGIGPDAKAAVPALAAALKDQGREDVAANAAHALGKIGPAARDAVPALIAAFQVPPSPIRERPRPHWPTPAWLRRTPCPRLGTP